VSWCFVAAGCGLSLVAIALNRSDTAVAFDILGVVAAGGALAGIVRNRPDRRVAWLMLATGIFLFAAGDIAWDAASRVTEGTGYPWGDVLYLAAYPFLAYALYKLARVHFRRESLVDSAIVALGASAVIWQWVIAPIFAHSHSATTEQIVAAAYPVMDVVLVVAIAHAVFTLPRWMPAAGLLFAGLVVVLVADTVYARLIIDGSYSEGGALDALWPISYFLLAGAMLHPTMRDLWVTDEPEVLRHSRARMLVLGAALFLIPLVVVVDDAERRDAVTLTIIVGVAAALVAWRITRLVAETDLAREVLGDSEARFKAFVQHSSDVVGVVDTVGTITYVSPSVTVVFGYEPSDLLGHSIVDFVHPDDVDAGYRAIGALADRPLESESVEVRCRHADGSWRWTEVTCTNQMHEPAVRGIVGNFRDITERRHAEDFGARETEVLEQILRGAPIPETLRMLLEALEEYLTDADTTIRLFDAETQALYRVAAPSLAPEFIEVMDDRLAPDVTNAERAYNAHVQAVEITDIAESDRFPELDELRKVALAQGYRAFWSVPIRTPDDGPLLGVLAAYVKTARTPHESERAVLDRVRNLVGVAIDRAAHTQQLGHLALHDTLTQLPNRALAVQRLDAALERLHERDSMVAVLFLDLDRFKIVNDGLGHDTGDELLLAVARRLSGCVRREDTVARFGGDEFVIVCEALSDESQAEEVADRAIRALNEPFALERAEVVVTGSIGIAVTTRPTERASSLLRDADAAMYRAKSRGGARYELFDQAMHTQAVSRLLVERGLREALERDELRVLFQAQFDLASGERVAEEALLRWAHPVRGLVVPRDFITVAEETGVIVPIGAWVLRQACERACRLRLEDTTGGPPHVSINVSSRQFVRHDFVQTVRDTLTEFDLEPSVLSLEVAEHVLLDDLETTSATLHALKDAGVRLTVDDFGTGGSSLTYLRRYPFDELKIDSTFVAGLGQSQPDDAIVAATIDMAHALGMVVAAEGVETEVQRSRLVELGCDRAQGYFLASPEAVSVRHLTLVTQQTA
jgi:diguanylate cyclase (GGDEF)-like protein/PAS domain S-box-containing protein